MIDRPGGPRSGLEQWALVAGGFLTIAFSTAGATSIPQRTGDESRLSFGLSIGASSGGTAWSISGQPILDNSGNRDTMALSRSLNGSISAALGLVYFPDAHLGILGEIALFGGHYDATCRMTNALPTAQNTGVCNSFRQSIQTSSNVALSTGIVYRVLTRRTLSPYLGLRGGVLLGSQSAVTLTGTRINSLVRFYEDRSNSGISPVFMASAGMTAAAGTGYQFRWEVRDIFMTVQEVTSVTSGSPSQEPGHRSRSLQRWTFLFGFEVVLDRRRGHRY
jgi:hypothetical protein